MYFFVWLGIKVRFFLLHLPKLLIENCRKGQIGHFFCPTSLFLLAEIIDKLHINRNKEETV